MAQAYQQHGVAAVLHCKTSPADAAFDIEQAHVLPMSQWVSHVDSVYSSPGDNLQTQQRLAYNSFFDDNAYIYPGIHQMYAPGLSNGVHVPIEMTWHSHQDPMQARAYTCNSDLSSTHSLTSNSGVPAHPHHRHCLSKYPQLSVSHWTGHDNGVVTVKNYGHQSVVGKPGMPAPAMEPKGPKLKFRPEDDALLVKLKEVKNLTWKQIADFFPGRSLGTLQVRYCTKLKAKTMCWTEDKVSRCPVFGNTYNILIFVLS